MAKTLDLISLFNAVTGSLIENRESLNQADAYTHDHGDNMVEIFQVITEAMQTKRNATPADQLAYASELLRQRSQSGSAKVYADGLSQASQQFQGKKVTTDDAMTLIQLLLGAQQPQTSVQSQQPSGDLLGSLLSGLTGSQQDSGEAAIDINDVISAGLAFLGSKQQGKSNLEALVEAVASGTRVGQTPHRAQSGALIANTILQMLSSQSGANR
jgi:hypothetical protein